MFLAESNEHAMLATAVTAVAGGTFLLVLARRIGLPAIVLLLVGGIALGPELLGLVRPETLGDGLLVIVELAIGLILFEGGLTLHLRDYRSAPVMIKRLLSVGVAITWLVTTIIVRYTVPQATWALAVVAASLVIVTGPTVIAPLLKRVRVSQRLHAILHWESVLIDPLGVFIAVLCFEWIETANGGTALVNLAERVGSGLGIGLVGGLLIVVAVRRRVVPADMVNVFALASAVLLFGAAEAVIPKAGLLSVAVAGFVFGAAEPAELRQVRRFKAEITDLLIATLFILLSARLEFAQFRTFGIGGVLAVLGVMLVVRPAAIFGSAIGLDFSVRERLFLSWIAPRGIVAASLASLFAISLEKAEVPHARLVETFTYSVIMATICIQGLTAGAVARGLRVNRPDPTGWLIVGTHAFAQGVTRFIRETAGRTAVMIDTNARSVQAALENGHRAIRADARDVEVAQRYELADIGNVLALTDNEDLNARVCAAWSDVVGAEHTWRCHTDATKATPESNGGTIVWADLPRPGVLSGEMANGDADLIELAGNGEPPAGTEPLAWFDGKRFRVGKATNIGSSTRRLLLRRRSDHLSRAVRPEFVVPDAVAETIEALLPPLLERVRQVFPDLPIEATTQDILDRERVFPTRIGAGVAVPHTYSEHVTRQVCAVARVPNGVAYPGGGEDDEAIRLVFVIISRPDDPEAHLALLAQIARVASDAERRERMLGAVDGPGLLAAVR